MNEAHGVLTQTDGCYKQHAPSVRPVPSNSMCVVSLTVCRLSGQEKSKGPGADQGEQVDSLITSSLLSRHVHTQSIRSSTNRPPERLRTQGRDASEVVENNGNEQIQCHHPDDRHKADEVQLSKAENPVKSKSGSKHHSSDCKPCSNQTGAAAGERWRCERKQLTQAHG